jgi:O-antigen/teichoic acid export membrane protein
MSGQGLNVISQLLLPLIFLRHYGVASYGEWLTLTATVSYLATLNFGLQTFVNNQVAICYNGGEIEETNTLQATALLLLLLIGAYSGGVPPACRPVARAQNQPIQ